MLAFRGNLTFNDTRKRAKTPPPPPPEPKSAPSRYRLWSTTQKERQEKDKSQPTKANSNVQDKSDKSPSGKVVVLTHGIPKAVVKEFLSVTCVDTNLQFLRKLYMNIYK